MHEIRDGIAELRGLPAAHDLNEGTISREEWQAYNASGTESLSEEARHQLDFFNDVWRVMRLIGPEDDLLTSMADTYGAIVAGFYQPGDNALVLVSSGDATVSTSEESTIAHEYVHSLQDARFDIDALMESASADSEALTELNMTTSCLIEGDASVAEDLYMAAEYGASWQEDAEAQSAGEAADAMEALADVPPVVILYSIFNYTFCPAFVAHVQEELGWEGVDAMYADPPTTTEQILHPEKYLARESANAVAETDFSRVLGDGWSFGDSAAYGEFDLFAFLAGSGLGQDAAWIAEGWGGGRMMTYRQGEAGDTEHGALVHLALNWDTERDFHEFGLGFLSVLRLQDWEFQEADDHWYWWQGEDAGYAIFDEDALHVDIIYATDATAAGIAKAAIQGASSSLAE